MKRYALAMMILTFLVTLPGLTIAQPHPSGSGERLEFQVEATSPFGPFVPDFGITLLRNAAGKIIGAKTFFSVEDPNDGDADKIRNDIREKGHNPPAGPHKPSELMYLIQNSPDVKHRVSMELILDDELEVLEIRQSFAKGDLTMGGDGTLLEIKGIIVPFSSGTGLIGLNVDIGTLKTENLEEGGRFALEERGEFLDMLNELEVEDFEQPLYPIVRR